MSAITEYRDRLDGVDREIFLGRLVWYSVSEMQVPHADCVDLINSLGLANGRMPLRPHNHNIFKRVCSAAERSKIPTADPAVFQNFLIRKLKDAESSTCEYMVVCEGVDSSGVVLPEGMGHFNAAKLTFDKATSVVQVRRLQHHPIAEEILHQVSTQYLAWIDCLDGDAIRAWLRGYVSGLNATLVRPGVYFVAEAHTPALESLALFAVGLPGDCYVHDLPLIDDGKQRSMIARAFEAETVGEVDKLLEEIGKVLQSPDGKVTQDRFGVLMGRWQTLSSKTGEYSDLLEGKLASTESRLDILNQQIQLLLGRVDAK